MTTNQALAVPATGGNPGPGGNRANGERDWDAVARAIAYGTILAAFAELGDTRTALNAAWLAVLATEALPWPG